MAKQTSSISTNDKRRNLRYFSYAIFLLFEMVLLKIWYDWEFGFATAWAAIVAAFLGVTSWAEKNQAIKINDIQRLSDMRKNKYAEIAAEILEKTYQVHQAIRDISNPISTSGEMEKAKNSYNIPENEQSYNQQGLVFAIRFKKYNSLFSEYSSLDIKAKIYLSQSVADKINDLKSVLLFIQDKILLSNNDDFKDSWRNYAWSIWSFHLSRWNDKLIKDPNLAIETKKNWDIFQNICKTLDDALLKYVQAEAVKK